MAESNLSHEKATEKKKSNDGKKNSTGEEIRQRSLKTFLETRKRNLEENPGSSASSLKNRSRSTGSDVVTYLKEIRSQKKRETALKEKQVENMLEAQQDLINFLQQQIHHQQEQTQQLMQQQPLQVQIKKQQKNAFLSVPSKFAEK